MRLGSGWGYAQGNITTVEARSRAGLCLDKGQVRLKLRLQPCRVAFRSGRGCVRHLIVSIHRYKRSQNPAWHLQTFWRTDFRHRILTFWQTRFYHLTWRHLTQTDTLVTQNSDILTNRHFYHLTWRNYKPDFYHLTWRHLTYNSGIPTIFRHTQTHTPDTHTHTDSLTTSTDTSDPLAVNHGD